MEPNKIRILIVGDELGQAEELKAAFLKEGWDAVSHPRVEEAVNEMGHSEFHFAFVDCMLPGSVNGVDFCVQKAGLSKNQRIKFVLMSGIFTDKEFIKEALEKSAAIDFIEKKTPFDVAAYLKPVKREAPRFAEPPPARKRLYQMFAEAKVSSREKRKIIESLEEVSAFDLPFIYSLLVETQSSGYLNIYDKEGNVSGITISQGDIVGVDVEDKNTFLGEMLIQSGYALPEQVNSALAERTNQKIGSRLIRANQLSPHAFDLILSEQMNIRLSRTIVDQTIRVNFASTDVEKTKPSIDSDMLQGFLHDWIASKIPTSWLKSLYMMWAGNTLQVTPNFRDDHDALEMGLVKALPGVTAMLKEGASLNVLLENQAYPEAAVFKGIHFLLTKGLVSFGANRGFRTEMEQHLALKKIWSDLQGKNHFEIVDFIGAENIEGDNLKVIMGAPPKESTSPVGLVYRNLKDKIDEAARKSKGDVDAREKFRNDLANKETQGRLLASQKMDEARQALGLNQFARASAALAEVQKINPQTEQIHLLTAWAKLGQFDPARKLTLLKEIEFELVQVPAEERYDAHYPFVLGLFHKVKGDWLNAKKNMEKAIGMNNSLIAARRELNLIDAEVKKSKDLFASVDIKGMFGGMFKKK